MSKQFDMDLFLAAVLSGSNATQHRHLRQAKNIQMAIADRWKQETPWAWRRKHVAWFLEQRISHRRESTRYYYLITIRLLTRRLGKPWIFSL